MGEILKACKTCEFLKDGTCKGTESIGDIGYTEEECDDDGNPPCFESTGEMDESEYEPDEDEEDDDA